jgi:hypothetical protein
MINKSRGKYRQERNYQEGKSATKGEENLKFKALKRREK